MGSRLIEKGQQGDQRQAEKINTQAVLHSLWNKAIKPIRSTTPPTSPAMLVPNELTVFSIGHARWSCEHKTHVRRCNTDTSRIFPGRSVESVGSDHPTPSGRGTKPHPSIGHPRPRASPDRPPSALHHALISITGKRSGNIRRGWEERSTLC